MTARNHVHAWRMTSPHPFGARIQYRCTSCTARSVVTTRTGERQVTE